MNKKGGLGVTIISVIFLFLIGIATVNLIIPEVTTFRLGMDCSSASTISDATKLTCLAGDLTVPYFIVLVFSISIGGLLKKFVF